VLGAGRVEALPELALGGGALTEADVGDLVAVGGQPEVLAADDVPAGLRTADGRDALAAGRARLRHDVAVAVAPVRRHLAAAGRGVIGRAHRLEQDLLGRDAEPQHEGEVAVVGEEPVVARPELVGEAEQQGLVARARDLEEHAALLLQCDLAVVDGPRDAGEQEVPPQLLGRVGADVVGTVGGGRKGVVRRRRLRDGDRRRIVEVGVLRVHQ
jgi:hypothetical protein